MSDQQIFTILFVGILWGCVLGFQRPAPRYSQQLMPETSFTCRHKIVGSYYADPETDCQLFHVCVSVAGSIQDYRFLCPNDTAFDQESQTCADWYDVDCEAATLYYASDNFDLYRLGSGLESLHYDSVRNDVEPQDHLQRSESSDAVRSSVNNLNRVAASSNNNNNNNNNKNNNGDILRGSSSSNFYNNRNNGKEDDYDNDKVYREESAIESRRQQGVRKVARKQQYNNNNNNISPTTSSPQSFDNQNRNNNYQNNGNGQRQASNNFVSSTTPRPFVGQDNNNFARTNQNSNQKYTVPQTTYRPTTVNAYQESNNGFTNNQQTNFNNFNSNKFNTNQQTFGSTTFAQSPVASSTLRPTDYTTNVGNKKKTTEQTGQTFTNQYNGQFNQFSTQSTTLRPSTNFQSTDYTAYQQKTYNNIQRSTKPATTDFQTTTTIIPTYYDDYAIAARLSDPQIINKVSATRKQEISQTTPRFTNNFAGSSYIPTTYSPVTKKLTTNANGNGNGNGNNNQGQNANRGNNQYTGQYEASRTTNSGQYREKTTQQTSQVYKNTQLYDTTRPNFNNNDNNGQYRDVATKSPKKVTQFNNYDTKVNFDGSTKSFDQGRSASVTGFSPASVNKLAESPVTLKPTTPVARPQIRDHTVYNNQNTQRQSSSATKFEPQTTPSLPRTGSYVSATPRPFSSTSRSADQQSSTTAKPKSGKKNDYDYAYYDNAGALEYDGIDLEQVTGSRDSAKISRN